LIINRDLMAKGLAKQTGLSTEIDVLLLDRVAGCWRGQVLSGRVIGCIDANLNQSWIVFLRVDGGNFRGRFRQDLRYKYDLKNRGHRGR